MLFPHERTDVRMVTTSFDDAAPQDLRIAELLHQRGLCGTFYVPLRGYAGMKTLDAHGLASVRAMGHEIGGHGLTHQSLGKLPAHTLASEVTVCKERLQDCIGQEITMFCYPNGCYDRAVIRAVRQAGYKGARTARMLSTTANIKPFEMPTTVQAFPHSALRYLRNVGRALGFSVLYRSFPQLCTSKNWVELGMRLFDNVREKGGVWHLYGHSWEIEQFGLWKQLAELLDYVAQCREVAYMTNGAAVELLSPELSPSRVKQRETHRQSA